MKKSCAPPPAPKKIMRLYEQQVDVKTASAPTTFLCKSAGNMGYDRPHTKRRQEFPKIGLVCVL